MEPSFWEGLWASGQLGFHEGRANHLLEAHVDALRGRRRVLVPLCGKAYDLRFLRDRGLEVVGIELVREAIEAFFAEQGIASKPVRIGALEGLEGEGIVLLSGDFFTSDAASLGRFDALYDRAALVALPPSMREAYVAHCASLLEDGALTLLATFVHDTPGAFGPPFSVDDATVRALYAGRAIEQLDEQTAKAGPRLTAAGATDLRERLYAIRG